MNQTTERLINEYRKTLEKWLEERERLGGKHHAPEPHGEYVQNDWLVERTRSQIMNAFETKKAQIQKKPF